MNWLTTCGRLLKPMIWPPLAWLVSRCGLPWSALLISMIRWALITVLSTWCVPVLTVVRRWRSCVPPVLLGALLVRPEVGAFGWCEQMNEKSRLKLILVISPTARLKLVLALFGKLMTTLAETETLGCIVCSPWTPVPHLSVARLCPTVVRTWLELVRIGRRRQPVSPGMCVQVLTSWLANLIGREAAKWT